MKGWKRWAWILPSLVLLGALRFAPTPLYDVSPGPVRDVGPLIEVSETPVYDSGGRFLLTAILVGTRPLTPLEALESWLARGVRLVPEREVRIPGVSGDEEDQRATSQMDRSKLDAAYVVLRRVTDYPRERGRGVLIEAVVPGCPADGRLFPGDLILRIDGEPVDERSTAARLIERAEPGTPIAFRVRAGGETHDIRMQRERCAGSARPVVGVSLIDNFPFPIRIRSGGIGGPSAGLMWALGLYDRLTPQDLTGGRRIAGTGEIGLDGTIRAVGSIEQKVLAAERAGAVVFLTPRGNVAAARAAGAELEIVPVDTFDDALASLGATDG